MPKSKEICEMRMKLIELYPSGIIRRQRIIDMPEAQIYAIYKSHTQRKIKFGKPRLYKIKQVPGQTDILAEM